MTCAVRLWEIGVVNTGAFYLRERKAEIAAFETIWRQGSETLSVGVLIFTHKIKMQRAYHNHMPAPHENKIKREKAED